MSDLKIKDGIVTLCCGRDKSCPQIAFNEDQKVTIADDYGNTVIMEKEQAKLIEGALKELEKSKS